MPSLLECKARQQCILALHIMGHPSLPACRRACGCSPESMPHESHVRQLAPDSIVSTAYLICLDVFPSLGSVASRKRAVSASREKRAGTRGALARMWSSATTFLYPRVKHYRKKAKLAAEAESRGLTGRQVVDAETPRREDEVVIHVTGDECCPHLSC